MKGPTWSARRPWFPVVGADLSANLRRRNRTGDRRRMVATVIESTSELFIVEVSVFAGRVSATFRREPWDKLTPRDRMKWVKRDVRAAAEKLEQHLRKVEKRMSEALTKELAC